MSAQHIACVVHLGPSQAAPVSKRPGDQHGQRWTGILNPEEQKSGHAAEPDLKDLQRRGLRALVTAAHLRYAGTMRYPDGGGLTAAERAHRPGLG
jgi:hypothetical protein